MDIRGIWLCAAALAALAGCGREAPAPVRSESAAPAATPALVAPIAPAAAESASPVPIDSATPVAVATATPGPLTAYPPRDECAKLPGFAEFRDKLFAAAKVKDVEALAALADPKINLDFGGGAGIEEFKKRLSDPKVRLWDEIGALSGLGCAVDGGLATMPWIFSRVPESIGDGASAMLGTGTGLALRDKPAASAKVVRRLDWPLVEALGSADPKLPFAQVRLADGIRGYMASEELRGMLEYRLVAERQGGEWRITALIAGD